jgi:hypothetical protein
MPRFTNAECADMHFGYGFCNGNSLAALRNIIIDIRIGDNLTDVFLKWCTAT